ncbi:hypothetical protein AB835_01040 [Candidatus Endobugula sertula]|uniref:Type II secretion system protein H n=1 Tax=Candidatus Endobugula sertula TaxID=62101 RepID=A0A1D2QTL4_9GAMM|nr:hypothetical protein AB835_01040 [Candidatus Endobugula sertula]
MKITYFTRFRWISSGFTLVELLVTIAIAAILLTIAVPSFTRLISSSNTDSAVNRLGRSFAYARSEAVTRAENVVVCTSSDGATCSGNWGNGWITYVDADDDNVFDAGEERLKVEDINSLAVMFALRDDNNNTLAFTSVCFNSLGEECNGTVTSVTFTATANGESSSVTLNSTGALSL